LTVKDVRIPDIGDAEDVEVVEICVAVGDQVELDGPLIVIESEKASMEVPSPIAGRITRIDVKLGDRVEEGQVIAAIDSTSDSDVSAVNVAATAAAESRPDSDERRLPAEPGARAPVSAHAAGEGNDQRHEVRLPDVGEAKDVKVVEVAVAPGAVVKVDDLLLVVESDKASMEIPAPVDGRVVELPVGLGEVVIEGSLLAVIEGARVAAGPREAPASAERDRGSLPIPQRVAPDAPTRDAARREEVTQPSSRVYAGPAVRRQARELGVDLSEVGGTGARGRILKEDLLAYVKSAMRSRPVAQMGSGIPRMPEIDFSKYGAVETQALSRIRRRGAENLQRSWLNVVHVTQHDEADVTDLETFRASLKDEAGARGVKLTPLAFIVRALIPVLKAYPRFNASLDPGIENLILKRYFHIGFAVDTPEGLVVPVLHDADQMGVYDLAGAIETLSAKARDGKLAPGDMSGGSFSVSSLGPIGGTAFTPIVNAPEVAILGISRLTVKPHWNGQAFEPRQFLPLSLSYDHRAINGAEAGRFVAALRATLSDVRRILL